MTSRRLLLPLIAGCAAFGFAAPASATPPERFHDSGSDADPHFLQCDGFEIARVSTGSFDGTVYFDQAGDVVKVLVRNRATDVFTNSVTGKTVTNRGVFQELFTRIDGTDDFTHSLVGYRFMATSPGEGVVLQDVGRIIYSPDEEQILFLAGQHNVPDGPEANAVFCAALS
jgi:hypothetical protein